MYRRSLLLIICFMLVFAFIFIVLLSCKYATEKHSKKVEELANQKEVETIIAKFDSCETGREARKVLEEYGYRHNNLLGDGFNNSYAVFDKKWESDSLRYKKEFKMNSIFDSNSGDFVVGSCEKFMIENNLTITSKYFLFDLETMAAGYDPETDLFNLPGMLVRWWKP
jgi:hypothetical protein